MKNICKKLLFPPVWVIVLLTLFSALSLAFVFVKGWEAKPVAYAVYVIAFYWVSVLTIFCVIKLPTQYKSIKNKIHQNKFTGKYFTDVEFKTQFNLYRSAIINLIYAVVNAVSALIYNTNWFGIFALYYGILGLMRLLIIFYLRKDEDKKSRLSELKRARICAFILMTVNLALSGAVLMMLYQNRGFEYNGILIYVMAMYSFYITTAAIIDLIKYRKNNNPIMSVSKAIKLASALVSMLALETAMLSAFGKDSSAMFRRNMIISTGAGISVIIVSMAVYIIYKTTKEIKHNRVQKGDAKLKSNR